MLIFCIQIRSLSCNLYDLQIITMSVKVDNSLSHCLHHWLGPDPAGVPLPPVPQHVVEVGGHRSQRGVESGQLVSSSQGEGGQRGQVVVFTFGKTLGKKGQLQLCLIMMGSRVKVLTKHCSHGIFVGAVSSYFCTLTSEKYGETRPPCSGYLYFKHFVVRTYFVRRGLPVLCYNRFD